jgi:hypothetical protein
MPLDLQSYKATVKSVSVAVGGETLSVSYRPSELTPRFLKELKEKSTGGDAETTAEMLFHILTKWDVTDGGNPVPLTPEILASLGFDLLNAIVQAVMEDLNPLPSR